MIVRSIAVVFALTVTVVPTSAQSTYVSAGLFADIVRVSHTGGDGSTPDAGGEVPGFALRIGTPLGTSWGVEAELARPNEIESRAITGFPRLASDVSVYFVSTGAVPPGTSILPIPFEARATARYTTLSTSIWYQQPITARVALAYVGGLGFHRTEREISVSYGPLPPGFPAIRPLSYRSESVSYGVRPLAGFESRISLTEHVQLVPGIRLQATDDAWLIRPAIALGWAF